MISNLSFHHLPSSSTRQGLLCKEYMLWQRNFEGRNPLPNKFNEHIGSIQTVFQLRIRLEHNTSPNNFSELSAKIAGICPGGSTNLWDGLEKGAELVSKYETGQPQSKVIFLFSDGLVNAGKIQDRPTLLSTVSSQIRMERQIQVSSYGLGQGFDEELMKGLAEVGEGVYFFIEGSDSIPKFLDSCLVSVKNVLAFSARLSIRGLNSSIVKKIYGHPDLIKGAVLGDLRANNTRTVLCEMEVKPDPKVQSGEDFLEYILSYKSPLGNQENMEIRGTLRINYTDNASHLDSKNPNVLVGVVVQKSGEMDLEIIAAIDRGDIKLATEIQEKQIEMLKSVTTLDAALNGKYHIEKEIERALSSLNSLRSNQASESRKEIHHREYRKRRNSACYDSLYM